MKDDDKYLFITSNPSRKSFAWEMFEKSLEKDVSEPVWFGVDWAKDSGMNRGDIIKHEGNVTHVRFKTV